MSENSWRWGEISHLRPTRTSENAGTGSFCFYSVGIKNSTVVGHGLRKWEEPYKEMIILKKRKPVPPIGLQIELSAAPFSFRIAHLLSY